MDEEEDDRCETCLDTGIDKNHFDSHDGCPDCKRPAPTLTNPLVVLCEDGEEFSEFLDAMEWSTKEDGTILDEEGHGMACKFCNTILTLENRGFIHRDYVICKALFCTFRWNEEKYPDEEE